jgi:hypothetical protein
VYDFVVTVTNTCETESVLRYKGRILNSYGLPFVPHTDPATANLTLQAPPPMVQIVSPTNGADFDVYDYGGSTAVDISFQANANVNTLINWTVKFSYRTSGGRCSACDSTETFSTNPGQSSYSPYFSQGGQVSVNASITVSGQTVNAQPATVTVTGFALSDDTITNRLVNLYSGGATPRLMTGIAMVESSYKQFTDTYLAGPNAGRPLILYGRQDLWPNESYDGGSHIGLMQVAITMSRAFDYYVNTEDGFILFANDKLGIAGIAESRMRQRYPQLRALTPVELENMALVLYGPYADATDAVSGPVTKQYYRVNSAGTDWIVNTAGNPDGVAYADRVRNSMR